MHKYSNEDFREIMLAMMIALPMMIGIPVDYLNNRYGDRMVLKTIVAIFLSPVILLYYGGLCVVGVAVLVLVRVNWFKY